MRSRRHGVNEDLLLRLALKIGTNVNNYLTLANDDEESLLRRREAINEAVFSYKLARARAESPVSISAQTRIRYRNAKRTLLGDGTK